MAAGFLRGNLWGEEEAEEGLQLLWVTSSHPAQEDSPFSTAIEPGLQPPNPHLCGVTDRCVRKGTLREESSPGLLVTSWCISQQQLFLFCLFVSNFLSLSPSVFLFFL